jgi:hypothetical protein
MVKHQWSVARIMVDIALLAVGITALLAFRSGPGIDDPGVGVLGMNLALILTVAADRALFAQRHRAFWLGFTATGWLCAGLAVSSLQQTRSYVLKYGPPLVRAREEFRRQLVATTQAQARGIDMATPPVSEWWLLASLLAETGLGIAVGAIAAFVGGLFATAIAVVARQAGLAVDRLRRVETGGSGSP